MPGVLQLFAVVSLALLACHALHIMSSCASLLHICSSHASKHFPRCLFCNPALPPPPAHPSCFLSCACVKLSRNGPRLVKWPYYTTRRPPVKFRSIWRSFGTPMVNRASAKSFCVLQQKNPSKQPKTHLSHLHCLGLSITIVWAKTALHLESPSSLCLYICIPPPKHS